MCVCLVVRVLPDVCVSLYIEVVEVVGVFGLAAVWTFEPLDDLSLHYASDVGRKQGQQETLLLVRVKRVRMSLNLNKCLIGYLQVRTCRLSGSLFLWWPWKNLHVVKYAHFLLYTVL